MTFFNKKEEVMKIELTPHGRYLLSIGKLKPHHYKFFDENVIYDVKMMGNIPESGSMGVDEDQNHAHKRITEQTPILKGNPNITGAETNVRRFDSGQAMMRDINVPTKDDVIHTNINSIGTNDYKSNNAPHYKVDLFRGSMAWEHTSRFYETANVSGADAPIPQLPIRMFMSSSVVSETLEGAPVVQPGSFSSEPFDDGTYFSFYMENPIIRLKEINGFDEKDNFILTAFKVYKDTNPNSTIERKIYERLKLEKRTTTRIENGILLDDEDDVFNFLSAAGESNPGFLSYYLQLTFDKEIPQEEICATIGDLEIRNIFLDEKLGCPDDVGDFGFDIYGSRVRPEDLEDCD